MVNPYIQHMSIGTSFNASTHDHETISLLSVKEPMAISLKQSSSNSTKITKLYNTVTISYHIVDVHLPTL